MPDPLDVRDDRVALSSRDTPDLGFEILMQGENSPARSVSQGHPKAEGTVTHPPRPAKRVPTLEINTRFRSEVIGKVSHACLFEADLTLFALVAPTAMS